MPIQDRARAGRHRQPEGCPPIGRGDVPRAVRRVDSWCGLSRSLGGWPCHRPREPPGHLRNAYGAGVRGGKPVRHGFAYGGHLRGLAAAIYCRPPPRVVHVRTRVRDSTRTLRAVVRMVRVCEVTHGNAQVRAVVQLVALVADVDPSRGLSRRSRDTRISHSSPQPDSQPHLGSDGFCQAEEPRCFRPLKRSWSRSFTGSGRPHHPTAGWGEATHLPHQPAETQALTWLLC